MSQSLEAQIKWEKCVNMIMDVTRRFPKIIRPSLGRRLDETCIEVLVVLSELRYLAPQHRSEKLKTVDQGLATIRVLLRLSRARQALSVGQYQHLSEYVDEVGRMIGGLRRLSASHELEPLPALFDSDDHY